jgi:Ca2+-binding EF-hand superfamily protein
VERILKRKISNGVKEQLVKRFDDNADGMISTTEFINRVVPNPMATLYAFRPSNVCLS